MHATRTSLDTSYRVCATACPPPTVNAITIAEPIVMSRNRVSLMKAAGLPGPG
jgi:hypothetical protein